jgi:hypothetical protein
MYQFTNRPNRVAAVGMIAVGVTVAISSFSIVRAEHVNPDKSKTFSCSSGTACVEGNSTGSKTYGVYGVSSSADGVHGVTSSTTQNSAVAGIANGTTGSAHGVYGRSSNGDGVFGTSTSANGVYGTTDAFGSAGVRGVFTGGSSGGFGVMAESNDTTGVFPALEALGDKKTTRLFIAVNDATSADCLIDPNANLSCTGTIKGGTALRAQHRNSSGQHVLTYASESATATIEDVGTARMSGGVTNVQIDPAFVSVMDHRWYYVFLTPLGKTRGLYVSMKTASAFQVREHDDGRSRIGFDYRVVAHPLDAKNDRLTSGSRQRVPLNRADLRGDHGALGRGSF